MAVNASPDVSAMQRVTFNPYRADTFTSDGEPILTAKQVTFMHAAGWIVRG